MGSPRLRELGYTLAAVALAGLCGCVARDAVATAANPVSGSLSRASYCQKSGPPALADGTCTGELAERVFSRAACACGALSLGADLVTDAFDARAAPWRSGGAGGDLAATGGLSFNGLLQVGGALVVSGGGLEAGSELTVAGDLEIGGSLGRPSSAATVGGAARIGGDVSVASLAVSGILTTPASARLTGAISAGGRAIGPVSVPPPCPCGAAGGVDVPALVQQHRDANHNDSIGLSPDALAAVEADAALELPCGRFYLNRILARGSASVRLRATGRTALFVGGDLTLGGALVVEMAPGAELDLFVAGPLNLTGSLRAGDPTRPSALRLWIGSGGAVAVPPGSQLAAYVYAPAADLVSNASLQLFGAVVAGHIVNNAPLFIHYDRSVAEAGAACEH